METPSMQCEAAVLVSREVHSPSPPVLQVHLPSLHLCVSISALQNAHRKRHLLAMPCLGGDGDFQPSQKPTLFFWAQVGLHWYAPPVLYV